MARLNWRLGRLAPLPHWLGAGLLLLGLFARAPLLAQVAPAARQRVAPAAPRRPPLLSAAFHRGRRAALRAQLPAQSVAVLFAAPVRRMAGDVDYPYHPDPDFYYLTGLREPDAVLLLFAEPQASPVAGQPPITELLFVCPRDAAAEQWAGARLGPAGAARALGFSTVLSSADFARRCPDLRGFAHVLYLHTPDEGPDLPRDSTDRADLSRVFRQRAAFPADPAAFDAPAAIATGYLRRDGRARPIAARRHVQLLTLDYPALGRHPQLTSWLQEPDSVQRAALVRALPLPGRLDPFTLETLLDELREHKQPQELTLLRYAVRATVAGHRAALAAMRNPAVSEADLDGLHTRAYRHFGAAATGYAPIVGAGANGCVLHYTTNEKEQIGRELVVQDVAAAYGGYTADVTRTAPGGGRFSPEQRTLYELVRRAQAAGVAECRAGRDFFAPGFAAQRVLAEGLVKLGIMRSVDSLRRYFPHGTSHYLGLDVHDRGTYGLLRPGTVLTVEPGVYVPPGAPCDRKWWGIGVRIEDDVLVTTGAPENLSIALPRTVEAVERAVRGGP